MKCSHVDIIISVIISIIISIIMVIVRCGCCLLLVGLLHCWLLSTWLD